MGRQDLFDVPYHDSRDYNNNGNYRSRLLNHVHNEEQFMFMTNNSIAGHYPDDHYYDDDNQYYDDINEDDLYYDDDDVDQHYDNYNYAHIDHSPRKPHGKGKGKGNMIQMFNHIITNIVKMIISLQMVFSFPKLFPKLSYI